MNPLKIEKITADAVTVVAGLAQKIWTEHYTPLIGQAQVKYMLDKYQSADAIGTQIQSEGYRYYIAYWSDVPVGYLSIRPESDKKAFLSKLYVERDYRGKGISRELLHTAFLEGGFERVWLTVNKNNTSSIEAYKRLGFVIAEEMVTDIGGGFVMDDYKMIWDK